MPDDTRSVINLDTIFQPTPIGLLDTALAYAERGWRVFPLHTPGARDGEVTCSCGKPHPGELARNIGKHPRTRNGVKDATVDPGQIRAWWGQWPTANIGIACGHIEGSDLHLGVADVDDAAQAETVREWMLPQTLTVKTGRGLHLYLYSRVPFPHGERDGVLVRAEGGYVVAPPSLHPSTLQPYSWVNGLTDPAIVEWLDDEEDTEEDEPETAYSDKQPKSPLFQERASGRDRSQNEFRCIIALISEGLSDHDVVSLMQAVPAGIRMRERGTDWARAQVARIRKKLEQTIGKRFAIVTPAGKLRIIDRRYPTERWMQRSDFFASLPRVQRPMAQAWFDGAATPRYPSICFLPQPPGKETAGPGGRPFNLWRGWAVEPGTGSWSMFEHHLRAHIANSDHSAAEWHLDFAAHMVQRPYERPSVSILHQSDESGTGKDVYNSVLSNLLRPENVHRTSDINTILSQFNKHLATALLIAGEEITFAPNAEQAEKLKGLTSMPSIPLEPKGVDTIQIPFYGRLFYSSNQKDPLRLAPDDRRVSRFDVPCHEHRQDTKWFGELFREMEAGGYGGLLGSLMNRDISHFDPRTAFDTAAKRASIRRQMPPLDAFICMVLEDTGDPENPSFSWVSASDLQSILGITAAGLELAAHEAGEWREKVDTWRERGRFYNLYCAWLRPQQQRPPSPGHFKDRLTHLGFTDRREGPREARGTTKWNVYDENAREKVKKQLSSLYDYAFEELTL